MDAGTGAMLLIEFSEEVFSPGPGIEVVVGGRTLTGGVRTRPFPANPVPEFWTFTMSPEFLNSLTEPTATIEIRGVNAAASNLDVDGNPGTFAFRQFDGAITACEAGSAPGAPSGDSLASFNKSYLLSFIEGVNFGGDSFTWSGMCSHRRLLVILRMSFFFAVLERADKVVTWTAGPG